MSNVSTLVTWLEECCADALGPSFSKLPQAYDVSKNSLKTGSQRYAVLPGFMNTVSEFAVTGHYTVDHEFIVKLTDTFATTNTGDISLQTKAINLFEKAHLVYSQVWNTRSSTSIVIKVEQDLQIEEPEILSADNVVVVTMRFSLRYRMPIDCGC